MGNLGVPELVLILAIVVIVFGVGRLPEVGAAMGKAIREFRQSSSGETEEKPGEDKEKQRDDKEKG